MLGESGVDTQRYLATGGVVFVAIAALSLGFYLLVDQPKRTGFETVDIGNSSISLSNIFWTIHIGLIALGILMAFMTARRNNGLLGSLLLGSVPIIGYIVGSTIYYGSFTELGYSLESIPSFLLFGIVVGLIGFILSRTWR